MKNFIIDNKIRGMVKQIRRNWQQAKNLFLIDIY